MWTSLEVHCQRLAWILNYTSDELSSGVSLAMGQSIMGWLEDGVHILLIRQGLSMPFS